MQAHKYLHADMKHIANSLSLSLPLSLSLSRNAHMIICLPSTIFNTFPLLFEVRLSTSRLCCAEAALRHEFFSEETLKMTDALVARKSTSAAVELIS